MASGSGYPSRGGLSSRQPLFSGGGAPGGADAVQISMAAPQLDLDNEIAGLRGQMGQLKVMSQQIGEESRLSGELISGLEESMEKARHALKKSMKHLNRAYEQSKSNHLLYLVLFSLSILLGLYFFAKVVGTTRWLLGYT
mmetsp:Transcript_19031/g.48039  ORF Transcript_19031/g.48039 Transcript_19031/m.48039 type:complete len:140 (+) Transcript_19031:380-799(+)|eukprot:jgi/Tetstr1/461707/TSEL_000601.t1